jgi:ketosteroid isomerase-like protein
MQPAIARDEMRETNQIFEDEVVGKRNFDAIDRTYTVNARILPPGADMISGRDNIREFWKGAIAQLGVTSAKLASVDVQAQGDVIVEIGRAILSLAAGAIATGKYVVVWKREDGDWKWHIDIWNLNA